LPSPIRKNIHKKPPGISFPGGELVELSSI
jgi:hypothetical protein